MVRNKGLLPVDARPHPPKRDNRRSNGPEQPVGPNRDPPRAPATSGGLQETWLRRRPRSDARTPSTRSPESLLTKRLLSMLMPRRSGLDRPPRGYLVEGEQWPNGRLRRDAPAVARFVRELVRLLSLECGPEGSLSIYEVAKKAKVNPQTVANLMKGETWGDVPTIYKLEAVLERPLWTHYHIPRLHERRNIDSPLR